MTTSHPAWATDPRGLPPAVQNRSGRTWVRSRETYAGFTPTQLEALHGPLTPLWPDTPPTSPLPDPSHWHLVPVGAIIPAGMLYAVAWDDGEFGAYRSRDEKEPPVGRLHYTEHPIPAPDPDADLIKRVQEALANQNVPFILSEDQVRIMLNTVRGAQSWAE